MDNINHSITQKLKIKYAEFIEEIQQNANSKFKAYLKWYIQAKLYVFSYIHLKQF